MKKRYIILTLVLTFLMMNKVEAKDVNVTIPKFRVALNNIEMEKEYNKYPPIVYKDITYFPMTYKNSRFLGISANWDSNSKTLFVDNNEAAGDYYHYEGKRNGDQGTATVMPYKVAVNGKAIDNQKEEYPLLLFRDVTYFPLTWRFCRDEFNWEYKFTRIGGLEINSKVKSHANEINLNEYSQGVVEYHIKAKVGDTYYLAGNNRANSHIAVSKLENGKLFEVADIDTIGNSSDYVFDGNEFYYTLTFEDKKILNVLNVLSGENLKILEVPAGKWDPMVFTVLGNNIYYKTSAEGGALFNGQGKKLNKAGGLTGLKREGEYVFATFDKGDNLLVFDENQNIVAKGKGNIDVQSASISNNMLTYYDYNTNKTIHKSL